MDLNTAPENIEGFYARLSEVETSLPKRLRQCAAFIVNNPDQIAVSTVAELSVSAGVQPSAFMRFCQELGFSGFSEMQKLFRAEYAQKWPDYKTRLAKLQERGGDSPSALLGEFVEAGRTSLEGLMHTVDPDVLDRAVTALSGAQTIHLVGFRRAFPVATYLAHALEKMSIRSILHSGVGKLESQHILSKGDALIAITFAPYSSETVEWAGAAHAMGIEIIAITDEKASPLARLNAHVLQVSEIDVGAFRALSATLTLAIALAIAVGAKRSPAKK
jgi:DNA-binding MurR/RpiR family transcriptional regulator